MSSGNIERPKAAFSFGNENSKLPFLLHVIADGPRDAKRLNPGWNSAIDRDLNQRGAKLVIGQAIADRPAKMHPEFMHSI